MTTTTTATHAARRIRALAAELEVTETDAQQWADEWIDRRAAEIVDAARNTARYQAIDEFDRASVAQLVYGEDPELAAEEGPDAPS